MHLCYSLRQKSVSLPFTRLTHQASTAQGWEFILHVHQSALGRRQLWYALMIYRLPTSSVNINSGCHNHRGRTLHGSRSLLTQATIPTRCIQFYRYGENSAQGFCLSNTRPICSESTFPAPVEESHSCC